MSKKPKTPDVAAVWHEVKGISNGLEALRVNVACNQNEAKQLAKHIGEVDAREANGCQRINDLNERSVHLSVAVNKNARVLDAVAAANAQTLEKHAEQIRSFRDKADKHNFLLCEAFDRIKALENAEIDAQGIGEQIGDLEVRVGNIEPLHAAVSMLEAKVAELAQPRSESQRMRTLSAEDSVAVLVKMNTDLCRISQLDANRVCVLNRECGTVRSVVTVLVIVQAFTLIAGLAWVMGVGR